MALKNFKFGFGDGFQEVALPEEHILQVIEGNESEKITDVKAAVLKAMREPINSKPLQQCVNKGEKVAIVVSDITRLVHTDQILIHIVNELNIAGIPDEDISIVVAQGTHRPQTHEEDVIVCGQEVVDRIKIYQHSSNESVCVHVGDTPRGVPVWIDKHVTDADKVILTGGITVHLLAGYGGGRKSILPGVASEETIQKHHSLALADEFGGGVYPGVCTANIEGNRFHEELCAACEFINPCFLVNNVLDNDGDFAKIVGGHWYDAWLEGTKEVLKIQGVKAKGKADVVIASPGGFPKDINLYQGSKTYDTSALALKKGGILIAALEAREINDPPAYMESFRFDNLTDMEKALREEFSIPFYVAFVLASLCHENTVYLVTKPENFEAARKTGQIPVATIEEAWQLAQEKLKAEGKTDYTINIMQHAANTVPMIEE